MAVLIGLTLPFAVGYLLAVTVMFPPPEVTAKGVQVPELVGKPAEEAERILSVLGLGGLEISRLPSPTAEPETVIAQSPLPGQQLRPGASVRVAVSSGPPRVMVPDVVGFPIERAASLLTRLGFEVLRIEEPSDSEPGRVIRIDPEAGTELVLPRRVTLTISAGMDSLQVDTTQRTDTIADTTVADRSSVSGWSGQRPVPIFAEPRLVPAETRKALR